MISSQTIQAESKVGRGGKGGKGRQQVYMPLAMLWTTVNRAMALDNPARTRATLALLAMFWTTINRAMAPDKAFS